MNHKLITRQMSCVKNCAKNNIYVALVLLLWQARQKNWIATAASSKTENLTEVNGESSFFFRLCAIETKIAQD